MRAGLPLVALLFTFSPVVAQVLPPVPAEKAAPVADERAAPNFAEGLKRLAELCLPPMEGAVWVRKPAGAEVFTDGGLRRLGAKLKGSVWKLPGETPQYLDFGSATRVEAEPKKEASAEGEDGAEPSVLQKMLNRYEADKPAKPKAAPELPDLAADVQTLIEALEKAGKAAAARNSDSLSDFSDRFDSSGADPFSRCLIFAAQLQAAGKKDEAVKLAAAVFAAMPQPEGLIDSAISQLANEDYDRITKAFSADHDWVKYRDGVKALLAKYPRGWHAAGAMAILMGPLEKRAAGTPPPPPTLQGVELKPEAVAKVNALLEPASAQDESVSDEELAKKSGVNLSRYPAAQRKQILAMLRERYENGEDDAGPANLWILNTKPDDAKSEDPVTALKGMGMDGVSALAAVAKDDTLTLREDLPGRSRSRSYYYGGNRSDEDIAMDDYKAIERPKTRGEIASAILEEIIPQGRENSYSSGEKDISAEALDFWKEHHAKTPVELALVYAQAGDESQAMMAGNFLAEQSDPQAHQALEKLILTSDSPADYGPLVLTYLTKLGPQGRAFFDQYSKLIHKTYDGVDLAGVGYGTPEYQIRSAGSVDNFLNAMGVKVGATSLKELIEKVARADEKDENDQSWRQAAIAINSLTPQQRLAEIGPVAATAPAKKLPLLYQLLLRRSGGSLDGVGSSSDGEEMAASTESLPPAVVESWKKVMARTEPLPEDGYDTQWTRNLGAVTYGDAAAITVEAALNPPVQSSAQNYAILEGTGAGVCAIMRQCVTARFEQKPLPEWPSADKVSGDRRKELQDQIGKLPAKEILPFAKGLPLDERAAVFAWISGNEDEEEEQPGQDQDHEKASKLPASVTEAMTLVVSSQSSDSSKASDPDLMKSLGIEMGRKLDVAAAKALSERLAKDYKIFSKVAVTFEPAQMALGYNVNVRRLDDKEAYQYASYAVRSNLDEKIEGFSCIASSNVLSQAVIAGAVKPLQVGSPKAGEEPASSQDGEETPDAYLKVMLEPQQGGGGMRRGLMLWAFTREDAVKAAASSF